MARAAQRYSSERPSAEYLRHRGPHRVTAGELDPIGIPGIVFAPHTGPRVPAVVLGHGYLQPVDRYADTLRFLASWGFVAAAPATERGPLPSHAGLALDLSRTLDRLSDAALHRGRVTVDRQRLAVIGHGIGGGAAVLTAAAGAPPVAAVATIAAAPVSPPALEAASRVRVPALHLVAAKDDLATDGSDGSALAAAWAGPSVTHTIARGGHLGLVEGKHWTSTLMGQRGHRGAQRRIRALLAAFLLWRLSGHDQLAEAVAGPRARSRAGTVPA